MIVRFGKWRHDKRIGKVNCFNVTLRFLLG